MHAAEDREELVELLDTAVHVSDHDGSTDAHERDATAGYAPSVAMRRLMSAASLAFGTRFT